jgi:hypothetical protein
MPCLSCPACALDTVPRVASSKSAGYRLISHNMHAPSSSPFYTPFWIISAAQISAVWVCLFCNLLRCAHMVRCRRPTTIRWISTIEWVSALLSKIVGEYICATITFFFNFYKVPDWRPERIPRQLQFQVPRVSHCLNLSLRRSITRSERAISNTRVSATYFQVSGSGVLHQLLCPQDTYPRKALASCMSAVNAAARQSAVRASWPYLLTTGQGLSIVRLP